MNANLVLADLAVLPLRHKLCHKASNMSPTLYKTFMYKDLLIAQSRNLSESKVEGSFETESVTVFRFLRDELAPYEQ